MENGSERLDRIERILEEAGKSLKGISETQKEMAARQQYHDEAFERFDTEMKLLREAIATDSENIRALARIAELHHQRLENLEGGEAPH